MHSRLSKALHRSIPGIVIILLFLSLISCAATRYIRAWAQDGADFTDRLLLFGDRFRLERSSQDGTLVFSGRFEVREDQWRFEIQSWKPASGYERILETPVIYVCRGRRFPNGLAFFSSKVIKGSALDVFMHVPFDFDIVQ
ncbi:MAG: hypothetical protein ABSF77_10670 [Spirochaetia bacterium]